MMKGKDGFVVILYGRKKFQSKMIRTNERQ